MNRASSGSGRIWHYVAKEATSVSAVLQNHFSLDPQQSGDLLRLGAIYSNKRRVFEDRPLAKGAYLRLHLKPKRFAVDKVDWHTSRVRETSDFLIVHKPAGIPLHASLDNAVENVLERLREETRQPLYVTGRLDTPVAGLVVLAKTPDFQKRFNHLLAHREVVKQYRALSENAVPVGKLVHYMAPSERAPRQVSTEQTPGSQICELEVHSGEALDFDGRRVWESLLTLHTGRTHQIRAQLGAIGSPILGDRMYGSRAGYPV
ncbi:RluA family pseudouridine synthase, partial [bacterium]|nr:RluA family pseudouridine synthase [bacterium]